MHKLHGLSPVVDQSAVANSTSTLDLTVLDPSSSSAEAPEVHTDTISEINYSLWPW